MTRVSFRLTHKIMAIALIGVSALLVFSAIYLVGSASQARSRAAAADIRTLVVFFLLFACLLFVVWCAEKDIQLRRDPAHAKRHAEISAEIGRDLAELRSKTRANGLSAMAEKVDAVSKGFGNYDKEFAGLEQAELRLGLNETLGLSGSLRGAVHDIEAKLKEADDPKLTSGMLMMRRHEKDFMLRRDPKYIGELGKTASEFAKAVASADLTTAVKADIAHKLARYQADFAAWAEGAQEAARHGAQMSKEYAATEPVIAERGKDIAEHYQLALISETETVAAVKLWMLITLGLALVIVSAFSFLIGRGISVAIRAMVSAMTRLAGGDAAVTVPGVGRHDEIGEMAGAVEVFKTGMIETERMRNEQLGIEQRQQAQRKEDMNRLASSFEAAIGEIIETVSSASTELEAAASTLTSTAERGRTLATTVASASGETAASVQSVASATEELSASVGEIGRQVQESARIAGEAVGQARRTNERVSELSKAANRIGDVVELINTIAGQTNLLALNATIEAARAGEAGRGFAVVASEVKALAEQTAKATGEIGQQISGMQAATAESVGVIKEISLTIERLSDIASAIAAAVEQQGSATHEISRNVQHTAQGTHKVSANIIDVQRGTTETGSASAQVLSSAQSLAKESNRLKLEVGKFLDSVRAA